MSNEYPGRAWQENRKHHLLVSYSNEITDHQEAVL